MKINLMHVGIFFFSAVIFAMYGYVLYTGKTDDTLKTLVVAAATYWVGSSADIIKKTVNPSPTA